MCIIICHNKKKFIHLNNSSTIKDLFIKYGGDTYTLA